MYNMRKKGKKIIIKYNPSMILIVKTKQDIPNHSTKV